MSCGVPTRTRIRIMMKAETTQLVIIELVIGIPMKLKKESAFRCTPSPAAHTGRVIKRKGITLANIFKFKQHFIISVQRLVNQQLIWLAFGMRIANSLMNCISYAYLWRIFGCRNRNYLVTFSENNYPDDVANRSYKSSNLHFEPQNLLTNGNNFGDRF